MSQITINVKEGYKPNEISEQINEIDVVGYKTTNNENQVFMEIPGDLSCSDDLRAICGIIKENVEGIKDFVYFGTFTHLYVKKTRIT